MFLFLGDLLFNNGVDVDLEVVTMSAPGTLTFIGEIKTALIDDHHEAFYWWWKSKLRNATLFHVDGHDDMKEAYVDYKIRSAKDYRQLNIANFICPAVHHGIISDIYWLNPHSEERKLLYFDNLRTAFSEFKTILREQDRKYSWVDEGKEKIISTEKITVPMNQPLILDIDLDAFCCHRNSTLSFLPVKSQDYEGALGFEQRIDQTIKVLAQLPEPNLITIASSQGDGKNRCYVPPFMVEEVSRYLAINLQKLYDMIRR